MRFIRRILLCGVSLAAMTHAASAEPISLAVSFLGSSFLGGSLTIAGISASQLALTALGIGASLISSFAGRQRQAAADPGVFRNNFSAPEGSEVNAGGRCRLGGMVAFGNAAGSERYRLALHSATELVAAEQYYLGSRPVTVEANGDVSSPPWAKPGGSWANWQIKRGTEPGVAWSPLQSAFPSLWTSAHKVEGIAQSLLRFTSPGNTTEKFGKLYQGGEPDRAIEGRWGRVYDPRDPACNASNPATWIWSMNAILWAARIMLAYPNLTPANFDWSFIASEVTKADASVATLTGTEARSQFSGIWLSEDKRGDTMADVLRSTGIEVLRTPAGLIRLRLIDDVPAGEIAFTAARHIIDWRLKTGPDAAERPNALRLRHYSAARNFEMAEINLSGAAWARIDDEIDRYGVKYLDIDLPFCPSASQAQRIGRRLFLEARADTGVVITNMAGMAAWDLRTGTVELDDLDETPLVKFEGPRPDMGAGTVEIPFTVVPEDLIDIPWNAATMEVAGPDPIPSLEYEAELATPAVPNGVALVQLADLSREVRLRFAGVDGGTVAEAIYRTYTGGLPNPYAGMAEDKPAGATYWYAILGADLSGQKVDFKVRFFNADEEGSHFSSVLTADPLAILNAAPSAPALNVTVTDGAAGVSPWEFDVSASVSELHVALLVVSISSAVESDELTSIGRPEVPLTGHYEVGAQATPTDFTVTAVAYSSNGTASAPATFLYTIPAT